MRTQTEQNERTLEEVAPGERGVILQVGNENGPVKRRLVDMGLTPGTEVTVRKVAPFGDPVELNLRGYELSLRKADAAQIRVATGAEGERRGSELFAGLERLDFVKCDVEGYELIVMHELRPLLERFRPTVLIETGGENRPQIIELFTELDYKGYTLENGREIPLAPDTEKDIIFRQAR